MLLLLLEKAGEITGVYSSPTVVIAQYFWSRNPINKLSLQTLQYVCF